jgi:hypothetical protein
MTTHLPRGKTCREAITETISHPENTVAMDNIRTTEEQTTTTFTVCVQLSSRSELEIRSRNRTSHFAGKAGTFGYIRLRSVRIGNDAGK